MRNKRYEYLCVWLARAGEGLGLAQRLHRANERIGSQVRRKKSQAKAMKDLSTCLRLADIDLTPRTIMIAADAAWAIAAMIAGAAGIAASLALGSQTILVSIFVAMTVPLAVRESILKHPCSAATRSAKEVLASSPEPINLMVMSLRHEPSLSRAIEFASRREGAFSRELRRCEWDVLTGEFSSYEEALQDLGDRWGRYSDEMGSCLNSMVTSTCESTEDGRRRALDRANQAMILGAKRRVEDYILSLSTPSMIIFGIGVLLPLMVGSFLPMMSWDFWSITNLEDSQVETGASDLTITTVFLMNALFPAVGLLAVLTAVSRNPVRAGVSRGRMIGPYHASLIVAACGSIVASLFSYFTLTGFARSAAILLSCLLPSALTLILTRNHEERTPAGDSSTEDHLFRVGARMVEGQNFEAALRGSAENSVGSEILWTKMISHHGDEESTNPAAGLMVVGRAAAKDERAAGILAMDLASYLRDLREIEGSLKSRLRPTISMMRMTSFVLGPVVLGVSYGIYLSLAAIMDDSSWSVNPFAFFMVLGLFLAESSAVVSYFIWAIDSRTDPGQLLRSLGWCVLVSTLVFTATASLSS